MKNTEIEIRPLEYKEWADAMQLAWDTFLVFEAPEYSPEGVRNFHDFVRDPMLKKMFLRGKYQTLGAFFNGTIIGILGVRSKNHISLLFVDSGYHHQGIATALLKKMFYYVRNELSIHEMTVNSSPYAIDFYHKIGFFDLGNEITTDGIRYTPMQIDLKDES
ncbi:MAG TPA: GNAT family N-acetyltransferase [Lachnospiraceae bacterium]|nr:GNAT family N-acetyltransferase [Lachnospiraceae bacterium]